MKLAYFTVGYPTLSQTFIQREVEGLQACGIEVHVFTCRQWRGQTRVNGVPVHHLPCLSHALLACFQLELLKHILQALPKYQWRSWHNFITNAWGILIGLVWAHAMRKEKFSAVHSAWATLPATVAWIASKSWNVPFSFGAHAYDLYRHGGDGWLKHKIQHARFVHTTTEMGQSTLQALGASHICLARRGLESVPEFNLHKSFSPPWRILSVGRLVEKKGHTYQLQALAQIREQGIEAHLTIVGEGSLRGILEKECQRIGLSQHVTFTGSLAQTEVQALYQQSHIFWHTGIVDREGDRDGLPNVIPEAMSHGLIVCSSAYGGAAEAIHHEQTGLIIQPEQPSTLAQATVRITADPELRNLLAQNAYQWVWNNFLTSSNTQKLSLSLIDGF